MKIPKVGRYTTYDNKRRRINKIGSKKKVIGKRLKKKYSKREKNRCGQICHDITNEAKKIGFRQGFENLDKKGMFKRGKKRCKKWNRWINYINWRQITDLMEYKSNIELVDTYHTSQECSRCGYINKDLKGEIFECVNGSCRLRVNRQANSGIVIYLRMEGLSQSNEVVTRSESEKRKKWFDENVLSEFTQTGAERKETNELVRSLYDLMKPQFYLVENGLGT